MANRSGEPLPESRREALTRLWNFALGHFAASRLYKADQVAGIFFGISSRMVNLAMKGARVSLKTRENLERGIAQLETLQSGQALVFDRGQRINSPDPHHVFEVALWDYGRSHFRSALLLLEKCLRVCDLRHDDHCRAKALRALGSARSFLGDHMRAREDTEKAVRLSRSVNDKIGMADGYEGWAWVELQRGDVEAAEGFYKTALEFDEVSVTVGSCEYGLGRVRLTRAVLTHSKPTEALNLFTHGFHTFGANRIGKGNCTFGLGLCNLLAFPRPDLDAAQILFNQARDHYQFVGNDQGVALCTLGLAHTAVAADDLDGALELSSIARPLFDTAGNPGGAEESRKVEIWAKEHRKALIRRAPLLSETWWQI